MNELTAPVLRKAGSEQILNLSQHLLDKFQKSVWYSRSVEILDSTDSVNTSCQRRSKMLHACGRKIHTKYDEFCSTRCCEELLMRG